MNPMRLNGPPRWATGYGYDTFGPFAIVHVGEVAQRWRWIASGTFEMGSPEGEPGRFAERETQHTVTIADGFWIADTPVTQALWTEVMGENPSRFVHPERPVEQVSWDDAMRFIECLGERLPELAPRLPTEAEWEFACRAGTTEATYAGPMTIKGARNSPVLDAVAWYGGNSGVDFDLDQGHGSSDWPEKQFNHQRAGTRIAKLKQPNSHGLYDMLGNVYELCADWYAPFSGDPLVDQGGPGKGVHRVIRGGSWSSHARSVRAAYRGRRTPGIHGRLGLRLARGPAPSPRSADPAERGGAEPPSTIEANPRSGAEGPRGSGGAAVAERAPGGFGLTESDVTAEQTEPQLVREWRHHLLRRPSSISGILPPSIRLADIYIQERISSAGREYSLNELMRSWQRRWLIFGGMGSGKSAAIESLIQTAADDAPAIIPASLASVRRPDWSPFEDAELQTRGKLPGLAAELEQLASHGAVWLLLDELDAVHPSDQQMVQERINALSREYPKMGIAVFSRLIHPINLLGFSAANLILLDHSRIEDLQDKLSIALHGRSLSVTERSERRAVLARLGTSGDFGRTPLCNIMLGLTSGQVPAVADPLAETWRILFPRLLSPVELPSSTAKQLLEEMALHLSGAGDWTRSVLRESFDAAVVAVQTATVRPRIFGVDLDTLFEQICRSNVVVYKNGRFHFLHKSLLEWLTAGARQGTQEGADRVRAKLRELEGRASSHSESGEHQEAITLRRQIVLITREIGDRLAEATALENLANAYFDLGQIQDAIDHHQQALVISRQIGDRRGESTQLGNFAELGILPEPQSDPFHDERVEAAIQDSQVRREIESELSEDRDGYGRSSEDGWFYED